MIGNNIDRKRAKMKSMGTWLIVAGAFLALVGVLMKAGWLAWFGKLPGDFAFEGEHTRIYVPFATMLLLSAAVSLLLWLLRKFGG